MTTIYKINPKLNLIYYAGFGLCTSSEFLLLEREAFKDPLRVQNMKIILDLRYTEVDVDLDDLRTLANLNRQLIKDGRTPEKTAIISINTFMSTLEGIYNLFADDIPVQVRVFNQLKDALKWLGLSDAEEQIDQISKSYLKEY